MKFKNASGGKVGCFMMGRVRDWFVTCWPVAVLAAGLGVVGCGGVEPAAPAVPARADLRVAFDSFVNVGYARNRALPGMETTRQAIETTLKQWYTPVAVGASVTDGTAADLQAFLRNLPTAQQCDVSVVYLGSIQDPAGGWAFVDGQTAGWGGLLATAAPPPHPCRIVILDACHAAAVGRFAAWNRDLASVTLLAAGADEKTYQFEPVRLVPVDVKRHDPLAWGWAEHCLGPGWDRHISFLGLMWIATTARTTLPPVDADQWAAFFGRCAAGADQFRQTGSRRWSSSVQVMRALDAPPSAPGVTPATRR